MQARPERLGRSLTKERISLFRDSYEDVFSADIGQPYQIVVQFIELMITKISTGVVLYQYQYQYQFQLFYSGN